MNNKGFMMAEVVVVSAIVLVTLTGLYVSYNKIIATYNQRVNYYDVKTLYELAEIRNNNVFSIVNQKQTINGNMVYYVEANKIKDGSVSKYGLSQTFKDYLEYLKGSLEYDSNPKLLLMERCIDVNNCKYAYLEVCS